MQDDAAHMGVVEIEDVPHLPVGERCVQEPEPQLAAEYPGLRPAAGLLKHRNQPGDGGMGAAGQRAADPVEHAAAGLVHCGRREVAKACAGEVAAQRLGQGNGGGVEVLVHWWGTQRFPARAGGEEMAVSRVASRKYCRWTAPRTWAAALYL